MSQFQLITPTSHLFDDGSNASLILEHSDGVELRERMVGAGSFDRWNKVCAVHLDRVDITMPWSAARKDEICNIVKLLPSLDLLSFHVASNCENPVLVGGKYYTGGKVYDESGLMDTASSNVAWLRNMFGCSMGIAIENNNYYSTAAYDIITDGCFITNLVVENDVMFLFDVAHAYVTSHNRKLDFEEYVSGLPLDRARQIHLCKHSYDSDGMAFDAHDLPDSVLIDYALSLVHEFNVKYLTIEYYQDIGALVDLLMCLIEKRDEK